MMVVFQASTAPKVGKSLKEFTYGSGGMINYVNFCQHIFVYN